MKKEQKKEFEKQIIISIESLLAQHNVKAAEKVRKHIKDAGKTVAKKFAKAMKHQVVKAETSKVNGVKKAAVRAPKAPAKKKAVKRTIN